MPCNRSVSEGCLEGIATDWIVYEQLRPSSDHSQIMFFTSIYVISYMREKMNLRLSSLLISTVCLTSLSVGVAYSRLYLGVHSLKQVVVGGLLGVFIGRFWYILTVQILLRSKRLSRMFDGTYDSIEKVFCSTRKRSAR